MEKKIKINNIYYEIEKILGSGDYGTAYLSKCGKVIKETEDPQEFLLAYTMKGKENDYMANVYDTELKNDEMYIVLEKVDTDNKIVKETFVELLKETFEQNIKGKILDIDENKIKKISHNGKKMLSNLKSAYKESKENFNFTITDVHHENIGLKNNGNFAVFDQRDKTISLPEALLKIKELIKKESPLFKISETLPIKTLKTIIDLGDFEKTDIAVAQKTLDQNSFEKFNKCSLQDMVYFDEDTDFFKLKHKDNEYLIIKNMEHIQVYNDGKSKLSNNLKKLKSKKIKR